MKKTILIALMLLTSVMTFAQIPTNGLVAEYTFSGNAEDGTIYNNDGLVNGATLAIDRFGIGGSAYSFDGIDDYIVIGDVEYLDGKIEATWNFWLSTKVIPTDASNIIRKSYSYIPFQYHYAPDQYRSVFWLDGSAYDGPNVFFNFGTPTENVIEYNGTWNMYTIVKSSVNIKFYKNGTLLKSDTLLNVGNSSIIGSDESLVFGTSSASNPSSEPYNGKLDDIRIYDRALNQNEITQLYNEGNVTTGVSNNTITNNNTIVNYQVYDLSGKLIYNNNIKPLNVEFSKGIYILKSFKFDNSVVSNKFIVQ